MYYNSILDTVTSKPAQRHGLSLDIQFSISESKDLTINGAILLVWCQSTSAYSDVSNNSVRQCVHDFHERGWPVPVRTEWIHPSGLCSENVCCSVSSFASVPVRHSSLSKLTGWFNPNMHNIQNVSCYFVFALILTVVSQFFLISAIQKCLLVMSSHAFKNFRYKSVLLYSCWFISANFFVFKFDFPTIML